MRTAGAFTLDSTLGVSGASGGRETADNTCRDRIGAEVVLLRGPVTLRGELMQGQSLARRQGYSARAGYRRRRLEGVARYAVWDVNTRAESTRTGAAQRTTSPG